MKREYMAKLLGGLIALTMTLSSGVQAAEESEATLTLPPASIAQWYKPQNERQVWLHTMFGLRRSMTAIQEYVALEDGERLDRWSTQFLKKYRSIPQMVPEWSDEVEPKWADRLEQLVADRKWSEIGKVLGKLGMTCRSCHQDYRAVTAALYRTPNFSEVMVEDSETLEEVGFADAMENLVTAMNRFKIAFDDQRADAANTHLETFARRVEDLGESCSSCHKDEVQRERILGEQSAQLIEALTDAVENDPGQVGRKLGQVGVAVCARCHSVHRTLTDLVGVIKE